MLKIPEEDVHVWFSLTDTLNDLGLLAQYEELLSEEELKQFKSFVYKKDSQTYLISRALLRTTLSRYSSTFPHEWKFYRNPNGKLFIDHSSLCSDKFSFNLTHTDGLVLVGLAKTADIGVDAEKISANFEYMDIAYGNFTKNEITTLESMSGAQQKEFFYRHWTLKESYLKAKGEGLKIPLNLCSFTFSEYSKIACNFSNELNDCPLNWKFLQFRPTENYVSSICFRINKSNHPKISVRHCVPLVDKGKIKNIDLWSS